MLSLTSVSASKDDIGDVADEFMPPCQRVHAITVTVYMVAGIRTGVACSQASRLDHSPTVHRHLDGSSKCIRTHSIILVYNWSQDKN